MRIIRRTLSTCLHLHLLLLLLLLVLDQESFLARSSNPSSKASNHRDGLTSERKPNTVSLVRAPWIASGRSPATVFATPVARACESAPAAREPVQDPSRRTPSPHLHSRAHAESITAEDAELDRHLAQPDSMCW